MAGCLGSGFRLSFWEKNNAWVGLCMQLAHSAGPCDPLTLCDNQDVTVEDVKRDTNLVKFRRWLYPELQPQWEGICVDVENFQLP